jgi:hypothetical protein
MELHLDVISEGWRRQSNCRVESLKYQEILDERTCIQIRTPLNSPLLGLLKALSHLLCVIEHFKDRGGIPATPLFFAQLKLARKVSFLARIAVYILRPSFSHLKINVVYIAASKKQ